MFNGYFAIGGNEVGNSERAYGYATTSACPSNWLEDPECDSLADSIGDSPYTSETIEDAPWYDPDDPEVTSRFLGLYVVDMRGLSDSTREASTTPLNGDGDIVSGYRHGGREVRVRGWMTAAGMDALEAGMTWLRNVLEPDACGLHGGVCGAAEMAFFVDCPPARGMVAELTPWVTRTNVVPNPRMDNSTTGWSASGVGVAQTQLPGGTRLDILGDQGNNQNLLVQTAAVAAVPSQAWVGSMEVTNPIDYPAITLKLKATAWGASGLLAEMPGDTVTIAPGQTVRLSTGMLVNPALTTGVRLILAAAAAITAGKRVFTRYALLEETVGLNRPYFDGSMADVSENGAVVADYGWTGTADNSASTEATRSSTNRPQTDDEYEASVASYRRYLHQVRAISGPFTVGEAESDDGVHFGRLVEFTLVAEVPWVYGVTKEVPVPPTVPSVVQDITYNLVNVPSAELGTGAVVVAQNYSTNPSVETDIAGWGTTVGGAILGANVAAASRSTEIAAVGAASAKTTFTAPGASAAAGNFALHQTVALPATAVAGDRYSVNMWMAVNTQAGNPVYGQADVYAQWQNAASTPLRFDLVGVITGGSGAVSLTNIAPPVGATKVVMTARQALTSWDAGTIVRLYADALAVTKP